MSKDYKDLLVSLDIGTSKVVAIVAELKGEGHYEVIGLGQSESKGLKKVWWSTSRPPCSRSSARSRKPS